jgi:hypothetical protein
VPGNFFTNMMQHTVINQFFYTAQKAFPALYWHSIQRHFRRNVINRNSATRKQGNKWSTD